MMTFNELAQLLETVNPATKKLYQLNDFYLVDANKVTTLPLLWNMYY